MSINFTALFDKQYKSLLTEAQNRRNNELQTIALKHATNFMSNIESIPLNEVISANERLIYHNILSYN